MWMGFLKSYPKVYFEMLASSLLLMINMSLVSAFLPIFAHELDPSGILVGLVSSMWFISRIFMEVPSGILADKIGRRLLLILGLALSAAGASLCSLANVIHVLIVGRALWGLGTGLFFMSSSALIFDIFRSGRGRALGTFQSIEFIGSFIGAPIGGFMAGAIGYRGVFTVSAILAAISFMIAYFSRELRRTENSGLKERMSLYSFREVLPGAKNIGLTAIYIGSFSRMFIWNGAIGTVFPLYLNLYLSIPIETIGIIVSVRTLGIIISTAISGSLSDRLGRKPVVVAGMLVEALSLYAYTCLYTSDLISLVSLMEGFGRGMALTSLMTLLSDVAPSSLRGSALGIYRTFMDVGGFTGPIFFMLIYEKFGSFLSFFSAAAIILITSIVILLAKISKENHLSLESFPKKYGY